jgi:hypothetical protein
MDLTLTCPPATARATLPQTSVEATTTAALGCGDMPALQPVSTVVAPRPTAVADKLIATQAAAVRTAGFPSSAVQPPA